MHHFCLQCSGYEIPLFWGEECFFSFSPCWVRKRKFSGWVCWKQWIWARCMCAQLCPALCSLMDCSLPDSSVHGIFQARILEWVAVSFSRGSLPPKDWTQVSRTVRLCQCDTMQSPWTWARNGSNCFWLLIPELLSSMNLFQAHSFWCKGYHISFRGKWCLQFWNIPELSDVNSLIPDLTALLGYVYFSPFLIVRYPRLLALEIPKFWCCHFLLFSFSS